MRLTGAVPERGSFNLYHWPASPSTTIPPFPPSHAHTHTPPPPPPPHPTPPRPSRLFPPLPLRSSPPSSHRPPRCDMRRAQVHNDVKPANIFACPATGAVKLADFGCCARTGSLAAAGGAATPAQDCRPPALGPQIARSGPCCRHARLRAARAPLRRPPAGGPEQRRLLVRRGGGGGLRPVRNLDGARRSRDAADGAAARRRRAGRGPLALRAAGEGDAAPGRRAAAERGGGTTRGGGGARSCGERLIVFFCPARCRARARARCRLWINFEIREVCAACAERVFLRIIGVSTKHQTTKPSAASICNTAPGPPRPRSPEPGPERAEARQSPAHSTQCTERNPSSRVWHSRVHRHPSPPASPCRDSSQRIMRLYIQMLTGGNRNSMVGLCSHSAVACAHPPGQLVVWSLALRGAAHETLSAASLRPPVRRPGRSGPS